MEETTKTVAADLDAAAAEAVETQEQTTQETEEKQEETTEQVAETTEKVVEELAEDELPKDHKERSELGRKVSAIHRRMDETDNKFDRILTYLESENSKTDDSSTGRDPDEPMTRREAEEMADERDEKRKKRKDKYQVEYDQTIRTQGPELEQDEFDAILAEMNFTYDPTDDPIRDAEKNFNRAEVAYLRKKNAKPLEKENPLKGAAPAGKLGVATSQKTVQKETMIPKLDAAAQSYIDSVREERGDEAADKLMKDD
jgi:hypothetical protein